MKKLASMLLFAALCVPAMAQTEDLGLNQYANSSQPILMAVDASFAAQNIKNTYLLFVVYLGALNKDKEIKVTRDNVTMIYQGQEYKMPSVKELRSNYRAQIRDYDFYRHLGKEGLISSWVRFYEFPAGPDFFPPNMPEAPTVADYGSLYNFTGFVTPMYFKNPGFKKGDSFVLKVRDANDPDINGQVTVVLK